MPHRAAAVVAATVAVVVLGAGCGAGRGPIDQRVQSRLEEQAQLARAALADGDLARAAELLDGIGATVSRARDDGRVSDQRVAEILGALGAVEDELARTRR